MPLSLQSPQKYSCSGRPNEEAYSMKYGVQSHVCKVQGRDKIPYIWQSAGMQSLPPMHRRDGIPQPAGGPATLGFFHPRQLLHNDSGSLLQLHSESSSNRSESSNENLLSPSSQSTIGSEASSPAPAAPAGMNGPWEMLRASLTTSLHLSQQQAAKLATFCHKVCNKLTSKLGPLDPSILVVGLASSF